MPGRGGRRFNIARASRGAEEALWNGNACGRRRRRWQTPSERERKGCVWFGGRVRTGGVSASPFHIHLGSGCDDDEGLLGRGLCLARWMGRDCAWDVVGSRSCPVQVRLGSHFSATQLAAAVTGTRDGKVSPLASHSRTRRPGSPLPTATRPMRAVRPRRRQPYRCLSLAQLPGCRVATNVLLRTTPLLLSGS